jgi:hypothetical protein
LPEDASDPFEHMYFAADEAKSLLNQVIVDYLTRQGTVDLAREFATVSSFDAQVSGLILSQEAGVDFPEATLEAFAQLHQILSDMQQGNLDSALE